MSGVPWQERCAAYGVLRRALGFTMRAEERVLREFVDFMERQPESAEIAHVTALAATPPRLTIRQTKFRKSRLVPIHATTAAALSTSAARRQQLGYDGLCDAFFVSERGTPLNDHVITALDIIDVWHVMSTLARRSWTSGRGDQTMRHWR